jgi:6-phosphogluconate dehydrogenase
VDALQQGAPAPTIAQAVFARAQSSQKETRGLASSVFKSEPNSDTELDKASLLAELHDALYCSKLTVYAQGFDLLKTTSDKEEWALDFANISRYGERDALFEQSSYKILLTLIKRTNNWRTCSSILNLLSN